MSLSIDCCYTESDNMPYVLNIVMLIVAMLSVAMLSVAMLNVMAPWLAPVCTRLWVLYSKKNHKLQTKKFSVLTPGANVINLFTGISYEFV
jgi:hypothetical protein